MRPFRFGVLASTVPTVESLSELAREAESLGYHTLLAPDPFGGADPLTALAAAAAVTSTLHVGTFVLADAYRDHRMLDWQANSLHSLTGGRFELGLGTGRPGAEEHSALLGREFGSGARRVKELAETVTYLKRREERPPLLIAGVGAKVLDLAAREADIISLAWLPNTDLAAAESIVERVRSAAGARLPEIELGANLLSYGHEPVGWLSQFGGMDIPELAAAGAVTVLPDSPDAAADILLDWRERLGISYITLNSAFLRRFAPVVAKLAG